MIFENRLSVFMDKMKNEFFTPERKRRYPAELVNRAKRAMYQAWDMILFQYDIVTMSTDEIRNLILQKMTPEHLELALHLCQLREDPLTDQQLAEILMRCVYLCDADDLRNGVIADCKGACV